jgi:hypothetical protein
MANLVVPFTNNPYSISRKTAAYTIPAGYYAHVRTLSALFSIGGTQIYPADSVVASISKNNGDSSGTEGASIHITSPIHIYQTTLNMDNESASTATLNIYAGRGMDGAYTDVSTLTTAITRTSDGTTTTAMSLDVAFGPIAITAGLSGTFSIGGTSATSTLYFYQLIGQTDFWVPSGTALSGENYIVELYPVIS